jgi:hypothetical protein
LLQRGVRCEPDFLDHSWRRRASLSEPDFRCCEDQNQFGFGTAPREGGRFDPLTYSGESANPRSPCFVAGRSVGTGEAVILSVGLRGPRSGELAFQTPRQTQQLDWQFTRNAVDLLSYYYKPPLSGSSTGIGAGSKPGSAPPKRDCTTRSWRSRLLTSLPALHGRFSTRSAHSNHEDVCDGVPTCLGVTPCSGPSTPGLCVGQARSASRRLLYRIAPTIAPVQTARRESHPERTKIETALP